MALKSWPKPASPVIPALPWAENEALPAPPFVVWDGPKAVDVTFCIEVPEDPEGFA